MSIIIVIIIICSPSPGPEIFQLLLFLPLTSHLYLSLSSYHCLSTLLTSGVVRLTEDFSYFTLLRPATESAPATSLFGISCTRQMDASELLNRPADVTRSTVQKAVVVIADSPQAFGMLRERLSVVTQAWFAQRDFTDVEILRRFQDSLADEKKRGLAHEDEERDHYLGLSLRELVREFRWQTLVLFKCCLLQPKVNHSETKQTGLPKPLLFFSYLNLCDLALRLHRC